MAVFLEDATEFCQKNHRLEGRVRISDLERLSSMCLNTSDELVWTLAGRVHSSGHFQVDLTVKGKIDLICQRCLEAFSFELDSKAFIILADSEDEADEIEDGLASDDPTEVIVREAQMDVMVLVEDEVLLSIPLSPRHEMCPNDDRQVKALKKESPFAVLRNLRTGNNKKR